MQNRVELNLGGVIYSKSENGIEAQWIFNNKGEILSGTGNGIRLTELSSKNEFEGQFEITYLEENGDKSPKLILSILFQSGIYHLTWRINEKITDIGIGFEKDNKLFASYKKVN